MTVVRGTRTMLVVSFLAAATVQAAPPSPEGRWTGTSLCQVKSSPCHDEDVVYHIRRYDQADRFHIVMNKLVSGVEVPMGELDAVLDSRTRMLLGQTYDRQHRPAQWSFALAGDVMTGTLMTEGNILFRRISIRRSGSD